MNILDVLSIVLIAVIVVLGFMNHRLAKKLKTQGKGQGG